ncbi:UDP-glucose 4-epimerase GalE [Telmatocola sphagniphila]|uniref:UDP-glucose 4-epimerase n=1 Tax=Telmatocola sphagniphila TaxID=1123043 RepID=A0A8E6B922_9BACT|nr:UDP-glucose 4-epimerase GalE [Telmatocola sphagniphila]QVL33617.1 UDP-glucose 4-epimerase GalE [Telmatocola sphagniphila]
MKHRVLVVGGAGYIGSHTVKLLQNQGYEVWVYDNLSMGHKESVSPDCLIVGDLKDKDRLDHAIMIHRIEGVIHFAASAFVGESVTEPAKYYQNNVVNTLSLLEVVRKQGIKKFVFSSTCATYGTPDRVPITEDTPQNPINPYGETKLIVEKVLRDYARAYQIGYAALRYFNASGAAADGSIGEDHSPETHLIPLILETILGKRKEIEIFGTDYPTPDGTCIRDYIHVDDLAQAHILALDILKPGQEIKVNLGIGQGYSVRQVIAATEKVTGKKVKYKESPRRAGDPAELVANPAKAMKELGWKPKYLDIETIIETAWNWHRKHPNGFRN